MGGLLSNFTVTGGAEAVAYTQQLQFIIIYAAMFVAGYYAITSLPEGIGFMDALHIAGKSGKLNVITTGVTEHGFDWKDRYNIWSGLIGGLFLDLSYFGTDQSQVGRYLTAKDTKESRVGLLMNGLLKVPLQFSILLIGCLLFAYYSFFKAPAFFNKSQEDVVLKSSFAGEYKTAAASYALVQDEKKSAALELTNALKEKNDEAVSSARTEMQQAEANGKKIREQMKGIIKKADPNADTNDTNYIFLRFVGDTLPTGLVGLIIAIIFLAAWGSIAAALNSLASCTMIDFHKKFSKKELTQKEEYNWGKI